MACFKAAGNTLDCNDFFTISVIVGRRGSISFLRSQVGSRSRLQDLVHVGDLMTSLVTSSILSSKIIEAGHMTTGKPCGRN